MFTFLCILLNSLEMTQSSFIVNTLSVSNGYYSQSHLILVYSFLQVGTLRFCGTTEFASGQWAGIELDEPEGKNNGSVGKIQYFKCAAKCGNGFFW